MMRFLHNRVRLGALAALLPAAILLSPLPAYAVNVTFSGGVTGTDPLGGIYTAGPNSVTPGPNPFGISTWGENVNNNNNAFPIFNAGGLANNGVATATAFIFTYTGSAPNTINTSFDTGLTQIGHPEGQGWNTTFLSPTQVEFTEPTAPESHPAGTSLAPGDEFDVIVGFTQPIDPATFSFTAQWIGVPEPAIWGLMITGFGAMGAMLRRGRRERLAATA
jgi:hypothetical protein